MSHVVAAGCCCCICFFPFPSLSQSLPMQIYVPQLQARRGEAKAKGSHSTTAAPQPFLSCVVWQRPAPVHRQQVSQPYSQSLIGLLSSSATITSNSLIGLRFSPPHVTGPWVFGRHPLADVTVKNADHHCNECILRKRVACFLRPLPIVSPSPSSCTRCANVFAGIARCRTTTSAYAGDWPGDWIFLPMQI
ncbi:hypothetical protein K431DRAFT_289008 [Polychaeton citri CBS 116435]|uniref:Secreted protein n=1 Tax=Polychaeton citri CBS 116435 TaxID=1314669 RepID=A0A9P4PZY6_9PEZI|nr:hypothetical protein K431DRAFT_289008 [Polychaeton citri CBS 116435]